MDFPCFLKQFVPLLGRFLGPGSRDCPVCHRCCCSAEGRPCQRAAPRVSLEQEAGAQTEGHSSCKTHSPGGGTPSKAKAQLQQLLLAVKAIKQLSLTLMQQHQGHPRHLKGLTHPCVVSIFTLLYFSRPRLWKELVNTQLRVVRPDRRILLHPRTEERQTASQEWGRWLE